MSANNALRPMNTANPLISVIIPTYNRAKWLPRAIDSVLAQDDAAHELLVIDDGSTDDTAALMARYRQVRYYQHPHKGVSAARNHGIRAAKGSWLAFLDSDDAWAPNKLSTQRAALQQNPQYNVCHTDEIWYRHGVRVNPMQKHQKSGGDLFERALALCLISPSSIMVHKTIISRIGGFDEQLPACEDYDLWLRILMHDPVLYLDRPLTIKYGGHSDQLSRQHWGMDRFRIHAIVKCLNNPALKDTHRKAALAMLKHKVGIYLIGARKRNKHKEIKHYEALITDYT